ncbi:LCP family protein [Selenomonas ruminis]|uniref:LytR family transcriptional regulator n=1 Tax=Selenomonas ruminis TaxID=2593411 RepID=A0A5D6W974_9FIRM|nr:LCP family protein [Selenomonas sp. mPRGC5]TYZ23328.1 LytR family transcriptional regulator [Selenomonas sp. mPRGC5]
MRQRRRQKRSYKRIKIVLMILLVILVAVMGVVWGQHVKEHNQSGIEAALSDDEIVHVMILGIDSRQGDTGRSDTMMVTAIDTDKGKAALMSVPRDTRVPIEGHGYEKINHAYAYGGQELTQKSVESLLGVKIDHYVLINTTAFERIIDALGGVDINVEKRMHYEDPWDDNGGLVIDLYPGEQHMDGKKAIQYVRYRDGEGDIGRIGRQQKFVKACLSKMISPQMLPRLPKLIEEINSAVTTDMSLAELLRFAKLMKSVHDNGLTAQMVPGQPAYLEDVSYWIPDITDLRQLIMEELGLELSDEAKAKAQADEDEYMKSLPKNMQILAQSKNSSGKIQEDMAAKEQEKKPMKPSQISVMVINDSGINGAGAEVAGILQRKGFVISGVETGITNSRTQTTITTSTRNTDVFYGMPFKCVIMDGGSSNQAVVHIGVDYRK